MAVVAILNFINHSQLVYYCTYLHEIWQVYYVGGPTCTYAKMLNKNKMQFRLYRDHTFHGCWHQL